MRLLVDFDNTHNTIIVGKRYDIRANLCVYIKSCRSDCIEQIKRIYDLFECRYFDINDFAEAYLYAEGEL